MTSLKYSRIVFACALSGLLVAGRASAQYSEKPKEAAAAAGKTQAVFKAELVDPEKKAKAKEATVKVEVTGVEVVDPATVNEMPKAGQGHLHYTVDSGPTIATTAKKLSFHGLTSGKHTIKVVLAANDHSPLGAEQTLEVVVP